MRDEPVAMRGEPIEVELSYDRQTACGSPKLRQEIESCSYGECQDGSLCYKFGPMIPFFGGFLTCLSAFFRSRCNLGLEILALRQQLGVLKRKHPRPRLRMQDRMFWVLLRRLWPASTNVPVIVKPETVVAWHRAGFRLFWRLRSRANNKGRPKTDAELRRLIQRMASENPTWGAPRIHGELLKLGFDVSERTVSRFLQLLSPSDQAHKLWSTFLRNHRAAIAAMDFFTVPTLTFRMLSIGGCRRLRKTPVRLCRDPVRRIISLSLHGLPAEMAPSS